ncbi:kinase-like protein [Exidia glandulosa HHB12029]|uniref:Kinase-like protein n=1 Tax=Exidia glandulosa HHB12029 TaxID=1314781 RepID=A0A165C4U5_EXIGL|nr:kinase-like protein [Exidia glandulosa HHB12029]
MAIDSHQTYLITEVSEISESISFGGSADVHRAKWKGPQDEIMVALKVLRATGDATIGRVLTKLRKETAIWTGLHHRNIQPLLGLYWHSSYTLPSLVSPWCDNGDINSYLKSKGKSVRNVDELIQPLLQGVLEGLSFLHYHSIVHGDLKGANILVSDEGDARICDFGLASMLYEIPSTATSMRGTLRWMAPELFKDDDARHTTYSDVWAFGCVVIEVLSGNLPYYPDIKSDPGVIIALSKNEPPKRPGAMSDEWWTIVSSCLDLNPAERPSVKGLLDGMRVLADGRVAASIGPVIPTEDSTPEEAPTDFNLDALALTVRKVGNTPVHHGIASDIWMGVWDMRNGRTMSVALKFLRPAVASPRATNRLLTELSVLRRLNHQNILPFCGISYAPDPGSPPCLVSPWMEHGNIIEHLRRFPDMDRVRLMHGVACGLAYLHNQTPAIIHSSLLPSNILIDNTYAPVIGSFNSVKQILIGESGAAYTNSNGAQADLRWMAPEVSDGVFGAPADVYAWSMVALQIISGVHPFPSVKQAGRVVINVHQGIRPQREEYRVTFGDNLWKLFERCWAHEPESRPNMNAVLASIVESRPDLAAVSL